MAEPTKAYYVERVSRCVVTLRVFAHSETDARFRVIQGDDDEQIETEYHAKGWGAVYRVPEDDLHGG